jgi:hypothetical protein
MATRVTTTLVDDTDGSEAVETVTFGIDSVQYELDLSGKNAKNLRDDLAPWVAHARKTGGRRSTGRKSGRTDKEQISGMRAWLKEHGHDVSERGRIPAKLQELYRSSAP